jgi:hypothetical protein
VRKLIVTTVFLIVSFFALQSEADARGFSVTASDKAFFEQIKNAVLTDDVEWFSGAVVSYTFVLRLDKGEIKLKNKADFKEHVALIFTTQLKSIVQKQSADSLFKNWQGVMIGDGEIWFSEVGEKTGNGNVWVYRIIGINLPKEQSKKIEK